jgi:hypothetical protein
MMRTNPNLCAAAVVAGLIVVFGAEPIVAQGKTYTPRIGSPERRAVMNGLRPTVVRELRQRVIFRVQHLRVSGNHAFLMARPLQPGGRAIDYRRTRYAADWKAGMFEDQVVALLTRARGGWRVVKYDIGATDVVFLGWWKTYGAPRSIFPP